MFYVYAAGTIVNGVPTESPVVRPALPFTDIHGSQHSEAVLTAWTPEFLASRGVKTFGEDSIPEHHRGGVPVDVETSTHVQRTYPNPILEAEQWKAQLAVLAQAGMKRRRDGGFMVGDVLFDSDGNANIAYLNVNTIFNANPAHTQRWKASGSTWVTLDAALFMQVAAGFAACNSAAYSWLEEITHDLEEAPDTYEALSAIEARIRE